VAYVFCLVHTKAACTCTIKLKPKIVRDSHTIRIRFCFSFTGGSGGRAIWPCPRFSHVEWPIRPHLFEAACEHNKNIEKHDLLGRNSTHIAKTLSASGRLRLSPGALLWTRLGALPQTSIIGSRYRALYAPLFQLLGPPVFSFLFLAPPKIRTFITNAEHKKRKVSILGGLPVFFHG